MASSRFIALIASARRLLKPIAAGVLLSIPFWQTSFGWLAVPCTVGYLLWLEQKPSTKQIWLSGFGFFAVILNWLYHINATELIPNNVLASVFLIMTYCLVVGFFSLGFLIFGWGYNKLKVDLKQPRSLVLVPALWALAEWSRSFIFSVASQGPGASIGPHWNFGSLSFAASVTPMAYGGRIVGQFGLSALVIATALGVIFLVRKQWKWGVAALGCVLAVCATGWLLNLSPDGSSVRVGVLQLDDSGYSDYGYQRDIEAITASHEPSKPLDLFVLPEYSYLFTNKEQKTQEVAALSKLTTDTSLIITSRSGDAEKGHSNLVTFYKPNGQIAAQQQKQFLIPAGEYIPYFYEWILVLSGNTSVIGNHQAKNAVTPAKELAQPVDYGADKIGSLACSGAIAPDFYRRLVSSGSTLITNSAALSTMGLSSSYYAQARQMASFIAISTARPFVQSARGAQVFILDSNGNTVVESDKPGVHYIESPVTTNNKKTPFTILGDAWVLIAAGAAVAYFAYNHKGY